MFHVLFTIARKDHANSLAASWTRLREARERGMLVGDCAARRMNANYAFVIQTGAQP